MTLPQTDDGIEILVQMAKTGQIDPWNLDIVQVADQYLQVVAEIQSADLKNTGKILLYLAILLRMKSDQLAGINYLDPPQDLFDDGLLDDDLDTPLQLQRPKLFTFRSLDEVIQRRTSVKQPRIRRVTLNELIVELKRYEELEQKRSLREKVEKADRRRMADYSQFTADDIEEMAHEEFLEDSIDRLKSILEALWTGNGSVSLTELTQEGQLDRITAYLALLFLTSRGEVDLRQEEFYGELNICAAESAGDTLEAAPPETLELAS